MPMAPMGRVKGAPAKPAEAGSGGLGAGWTFAILFGILVVLGGTVAILYPTIRGDDDEAAPDVPTVAEKDARVAKPVADVPAIASRPDTAVAVVKPVVPQPEPPKVVTPPPQPKTLAELLKCPAGTAKVVVDKDAKDGPDVDLSAVAFCMDAFEFPGRGEKPKTGVSAGTAMKMCKEAGRRLCTGLEWKAACGTALPYGDDYKDGACNVGSDKIGPSGASAECKTRAGVFDLVGNASEWASDGVLHGGDASGGKGASCKSTARRFMPGPTNGFRCCADAAR
jgi:hypothetical protein